MPKPNIGGRSAPGFFKSFELKIVLIIVMTAITTAVAVFFVAAVQNNKATINNMRVQLNIVGPRAVDAIDHNSFYFIRDESDMQTELYRLQNERLDEIRRISGLKCLYTVRKSETGEFVYSIDGHPSDSPDFFPAGHAVEQDLIADLEKAMRGKSVMSETIRDTGFGPAYISFWPVVDASGAVIGVIGLEFDAEHLLQFDRTALLFSATMTLFLIVVMCVIFTAIYKRVSTPFQRKLAYTDFLTGLNNRTAFELDLRSKHVGEKEIIVIFDLNNLKLVNDNHGHKWGDEYLKCAANIIQGCFVDLGEAYRIGGDEFALISREPNAALIEEKLRTAFMSAVDDIRNSNTLSAPTEYFSIAYGLAQYEPERHETLHEVFDEADKNMYVMKKQMKSSVCELEPE